MADDRLMVRGAPAFRSVASMAVVVGAACWIVDGWLVAQGLPNWFLETSVTVAQLGGALTAVGGLAWLAAWIFPRGRRPAVHADAKELPFTPDRILSVAGWLALLVGAVLLRHAATTGHATVVAGGAAAVLAGTAAVVAAAARRQTLRLLLAHHHASAAAERPVDPRTHEVIMALDALLGHLLEEDVRAFLATPQAPLYLQLLAESRAAAEAAWMGAEVGPAPVETSERDPPEDIAPSEEEAPDRASSPRVEARVAEGGRSHV